MKKTLLIFSICASLFASVTATAQDFPYTLSVFNDAVYYGMYEATVDDTHPVPEGAIRHTNSSYAKMLTPDQLASFGNSLTMTVTLEALCDNYDRIGNVNMVLVPIGQATYGYNDENIKRMEIGRFITPFMDMHLEPSEVPYVFEVDNLTYVFHDEAITSEYNIWIELEVYGYQGGPGQGGAAVQIPGCAERNDVYMGSLEFTSDNNPNLVSGDDNFLLPLSYKYELKNYTLDGTDVLGETVKTITFELEEDVPNAKFHFINSNHGSNEDGEEYERRDHFIYLDDQLVLEYKPGGKSCEPYRQYNTQGNGIYGPTPRSLSAWLSFNNWCPGDIIPIRTIELGDLEAGEHSFKIEVPDAVFADGQGYFPMSVYLQGYTTTLGAEDFNAKAFSIYPNPVTNIATIEAEGKQIKAVTVINTLGQTVFEGSTETADLSQLQSGVYIIKVLFDNNLTATKKIVKK